MQMSQTSRHDENLLSRAQRKVFCLCCLVAACSLAACWRVRSDHPLEHRARRVVVTCPEELTPRRNEQHAFAAAVCTQHCPKAARAERLAGCFHVRTYFHDDRQRLAPGAEALMACEYSEAQ